jgi:hypothetical protein
MNRLARTLGRIAMIVLAAALFAGLTGIYAHSIRPAAYNRREMRRRPPEMQLSRLPSVIRQCGIFVLLGFVGRKLFRLGL